MSRLTIEEVNSFRPTAENQLLVVSDTGAFKLFGNEIRIISPFVDGKCCFLGEEGYGVLLESQLKEFPSLSTEKVLRTALYEKINELESFVYFAFDDVDLAELVDDLKYNVSKHFGLRPKKQKEV
jgi:hypothetical protein